MGTRHKATASKRKSTVFFRGRSLLSHWLFLNLPKSSAHASVAWHHSHPQVLSGIFILPSVNDTSALRTRVNTCAHVCTQLTYVLSRKVLSLTKSKGKIYKTKSLGYYITSVVSLGWASMMLEDPKLVRTPRKSLSRRSCALFECMITILNIWFIKK